MPDGSIFASPVKVSVPIEKDACYPVMAGCEPERSPHSFSPQVSPPQPICTIPVEVTCPTLKDALIPEAVSPTSPCAAQLPCPQLSAPHAFDIHYYPYANLKIEADVVNAGN